jgi:hypothetical protein
MFTALPPRRFARFATTDRQHSYCGPCAAVLHPSSTVHYASNLRPACTTSTPTFPHTDNTPLFRSFPYPAFILLRQLRKLPSLPLPTSFLSLYQLNNALNHLYALQRPATHFARHPTHSRLSLRYILYSYIALAINSTSHQPPTNNPATHSRRRLNTSRSSSISPHHRLQLNNQEQNHLPSHRYFGI